MPRNVLSLALTTLVALTVFGDEASAQRGRRTKTDQAFSTGSTDTVVEYVNQRMRKSWEENLVEPSPVASDAEWLRRVYLDIAGHIPPAEKVEQFLADEDPAKRSKLIDELLDSPDYVRNMTTVWTNHCVGRQAGDRVNRDQMAAFWREVFARNRPWDEVVVELMTAEGYTMIDQTAPRPEDAGEMNGAINYWLAQMQNNDDMVQATAKTARLFLGIQVQCTQCHDHPFNDWKQDQFWQFNSFFRQMRAQRLRRYDEQTGRMEDWYMYLGWNNFEGPVYFEKRSGLMQVAYPEYRGQEVDPSIETDRRKEFAKLIVEGERPLIAKAMVNRTWGQFFGYGFTKPVDDMGPHNPVMDQELFDRLVDEFVKSRYDVKQLVRWIANTEAYNLTSRFNPKNEQDNPAAGEVPLFSHAYVKSLTPEQLFDSLIVATKAHESGRTSWEKAEQQRRRWMQQFVIAFNTDENDETTTFNGTIPQALMMMNGDLTKDAIDAEKGGFLYEALSSNKTDEKRVRALYLSTLSREPTREESRKLVGVVKSIRDPKKKLQTYQDLFWALLNSNEFIFNH